MEAAITAAGVVAFYGGLAALSFLIGEGITLGYHAIRRHRARRSRR